VNDHGLFDTHAHYDHAMFEGRGAEIVGKLFAENVINGVIIPAITFESNFDRELFPEERFPEIYFAAGLHPKCATNEARWDAKKRERFEAIVDDPRTVAIKTGLDFSKKKLTEGQKAHQIMFFREMIGLANEKQLPLVLHVRDAAPEAVQVLRETPMTVRAVAHCFTYDIGVAREMMSVGVTCFGIGGMLTREPMGALRDCVRELPLSAILLETDCPFVKPEGFGGNVNTSETLLGTAGLIAELKGTAVEEVIRAVQENARAFYGIR